MIYSSEKSREWHSLPSSLTCEIWRRTTALPTAPEYPEGLQECTRIVTLVSKTVCSRVIQGSIQRVCKSMQGSIRRVCKSMQGSIRRVCKSMQGSIQRVCKSMQGSIWRVCKIASRECKVVLRGYAYHKTSQQQSCSVRSTFAGGISLTCQPSQHPTCSQHRQEKGKCVCVVCGCVWEGEVWRRRIPTCMHHLQLVKANQ